MRWKSSLLLGLTCVGSSASAQTSTCMRMGDNMVQCHSADGSSTNCIGMGDTMASCTTTGGYDSYNDGGAALGKGLGDLIAGIGERSFRKKVGKMLADGDCQGAGRYALEKGRLELGTSILQACSSQHANAMGAGASIEQSLQQIAGQSKTPHQLAPDLWITEVKAYGRQLVFTALSEADRPSLSSEDRLSFVNQTCSFDPIHPLLRAGATVRTVFLDTDGNQYASILVGSPECGL